MITDIEYQHSIKKHKNIENDVMTNRKNTISDRVTPVGKNSIRMQ